MIKPILLGCALLTGLAVTAQDDLMKMLNSGPSANDPVVATFKSTQIINATTTEFLKEGNLDFRVTHRFGSIGGDANGTVHNLWGFDDASDINIAFNYGITDKLMVGVNRSRLGETYMGFIKYAALQQTTNNHIPVSVALYANTAWTTTVQNPDTSGGGSSTASRGSYIGQVIIARKFNRNISFEVLPTFFHRNFIVDPKDNNNLFALGFGGRVRVTRSSTIVGDYFYTFSKFYNGGSAYRSPELGNTNSYYPSLGLGWEIETGGHVFTLMFSNNAGIIENNFLTNTTDSWMKGGYKFSFIISRVFKT